MLNTRILYMYMSVYYIIIIEACVAKGIHIAMQLTITSREKLLDQVFQLSCISQGDKCRLIDDTREGKRNRRGEIAYIRIRRKQAD